jgi:hypothetical protein
MFNDILTTALVDMNRKEHVEENFFLSKIPTLREDSFITLISNLKTN